MVKNKPANSRGARDVGSVPGLGTSPEEEDGNTLYYSCLGNPRDCKEPDVECSEIAGLPEEEDIPANRKIKFSSAPIKVSIFS